MFDDAAKVMNLAFFYPIVFIFACIFIYIAFGALFYFRFLARWIPEFLATFAGFAGSAYILYLCIIHYSWIKGFVANWSLPKIFIGGAIIIILFAVSITFGFGTKGKKSRTGKTTTP